MVVLNYSLADGYDKCWSLGVRYGSVDCRSEGLLDLGGLQVGTNNCLPSTIRNVKKGDNIWPLIEI